MKVWRLYLDEQFSGEFTRGIYVSREAAELEIENLQRLRLAAKQRWMDSGKTGPAYWNLEYDEPGNLSIEESELLTEPAYYKEPACLTA
jgi:hypothetical protein